MENSHANYATLNGGKLVVSNNPMPSDTKTCLKDVNYRIDNGVLYIVATKIKYFHISDFAVNLFPDSLLIARERHVWVIKKSYKETFKSSFEEFPEEKQIRIHRLLWRDKFIMAYETLRDDPNAKYWFKLNGDEPFVRAISNFELNEDKLEK